MNTVCQLLLLLSLLLPFGLGVCQERETSTLGRTVAATIIRGPYLQSGSSTSIVVRWRTDVPVDTRICYGLTQGEWSHTNDLTGFSTEHEVLITGLEPGTRYFYAIGATTETLVSGPEYFFTTHPTNAKPTRVWVIGDTQEYGSSQQLAVRDAYYNFTGTTPTDLCLFLGDNSGLWGEDWEFQSCLFDVYGDMLRHVVAWPTIGNHDTNNSSVPNFPYLDVFTLPTNGEAGGLRSSNELYYSFNYGNIHFVCLDSFTRAPADHTNMYQWLAADLAANTNDWLIAFWHAPPYSRGSHDSDSTLTSELPMTQMREKFVPLLEQYGVDLVLSGHSHGYERSFFVDGFYGYSTDMDGHILNAGNGRPEQNGAYYKPTAGLGPHEGAVYVVAGSSGGLRCGTMDHPLMCQSLCEMGSLVLDIDELTLNATFLNGSGTVRDNLTIRKGLPRAIISIEGAQVVLTWEGVPGYSYQIYRRNDFNSPWELAGSNLLPATNPMRWVDNPSGNPRTVFYKLVAERQ